MNFQKIFFYVFLIGGLSLLWNCQTSSTSNKDQHAQSSKDQDDGVSHSTKEPISICISIAKKKGSFGAINAGVGDTIEISANVNTSSDLEGLTIEFVSEGSLQIIGKKEIAIGSLGAEETYLFKTTARLAEVGTYVLKGIAQSELYFRRAKQYGTIEDNRSFFGWGGVESIAIDRLKYLRRKGEISDSEFRVQKRQLEEEHSRNSGKTTFGNKKKQ